jgi:hypothetical protein
VGAPVTLPVVLCRLPVMFRLLLQYLSKALFQEPSCGKGNGTRVPGVRVLYTFFPAFLSEQELAR